MESYKSLTYDISPKDRTISVFGPVDDLVSLVEKIEDQRKPNGKSSRHFLEGLSQTVKQYKRGEVEIEDLQEAVDDSQLDFCYHRTQFRIDYDLKDENNRVEIKLTYFPNTNTPRRDEMERVGDMDFEEIENTFIAALEKF